MFKTILGKDLYVLRFKFKCVEWSTKLTIRDLAPKNLRYDLLSYKLLMIVKKKYINLTFLKIFGILLYFYNLKLVTAIGPFCFIYKMQVVYILQSMHF